MLEKNNKIDFSLISDLTKITKEGLITLIGIIIGKGLYFFYTLYIARLLGANDLGIYFLGTTIIIIISSLANLGLNVGVTRYFAIYNIEGNKNKLKGTIIISLFFSIITSFIFILIILLLSNFVSNFVFKKPQLSIVLKIICLSLPFESAMKIFLGATQGLKLMQYIALIENILWIGLRFLYTIFLFLFLGKKIENLIYAYVLSSLTSSFFAFYFFNKKIPILNKKIKPIFEIKPIIKFSFMMSLSEFLSNMSRQIEHIMLGYFIPAFGIGIYGVAVRIVFFAEFIFRIFDPIFNPFVSELYEKKNFLRLSQILKTITRWNVIISFPIFIILFVYSKYFLNIFGSVFSEANHSFSILIIAHIISSVSIPLSTMIFMSGKSNISAINNLFMLLMNVILNYFLIPKYGILGAAISSGICLFTLSILRILEVYFLMKIHPFSITLWKPVISVFISLIVISLIDHTITKYNFINTSIFTFFCLYGILVYIFKMKEEDIYINKILFIKMKTFIRQFSLAIIRKSN